MELSKGQYKDIILSIDEENIKCADCGKENPTKVSVNNGIILCEGCALQHLELGPNVSYIRDLSGEFDIIFACNSQFLTSSGFIKTVLVGSDTAAYRIEEVV